MSFIPNTTPTPNWLYNGEMKKMNGTELKVVLLVTRKTLGWFDPMTSERKTQDYISQSQFIKFTGQSHTAIAHAIQSCVERGWIVAKDKTGKTTDSPEKRRRRKIWYQLGTVFTKKLSSEESSQESKQQSGQDNLSNISQASKQHFASNLSNKVDITKETITKETITKLAMTSIAGKEINELLFLFKEVNPTIERYAGNITQRKAIERMLREYGREKLISMIRALPAVNGKKYWPKSTTPLQLEGNIPIYRAKNEENKSEKKNIIIS